MIDELVDIIALFKEVDPQGAGSRISVTVSGKTAHFHRPHPGKEAKKYQVENAREFLQQLGVIP